MSEVAKEITAGIAQPGPVKGNKNQGLGAAKAEQSILFDSFELLQRLSQNLSKRKKTPISSADRSVSIL